MVTKSGALLTLSFTVTAVRDGSSPPRFMSSIAFLSPTQGVGVVSSSFPSTASASVSATPLGVSGTDDRRIAGVDFDASGARHGGVDVPASLSARSAVSVADGIVGGSDAIPSDLAVLDAWIADLGDDDLLPLDVAFS